MAHHSKRLSIYLPVGLSLSISPAGHGPTDTPAALGLPVPVRVDEGAASVATTAASRDQLVDTLGMVATDPTVVTIPTERSLTNIRHPKARKSQVEPSTFYDSNPPCFCARAMATSRSLPPSRARMPPIRSADPRTQGYATMKPTNGGVNPTESSPQPTRNMSKEGYTP